jgi:hypothetical protein
MKKTDWIGAFVTLIATGIGYFVSGPKVAAACIVIGTLGALIIHFAGRKGNDGGGESKLQTEAKDSFNPTNTNSASGGNVKVEQHFHGIPSTTSPTPISSLPPQSVAAQRTPNVRYKSVRTCYLGVGEDATGEFLREIDHDTGASAIVACYRNEPTVGIRTATGVEAHLTLRDAEGEEIGTGVSKACWLNSPREDIDLEPGVPQHVVLLMKDKEEVTVPWKQWRSPGGLESGFYSVPRAVASIEVEIIDSRGEPLVPKLTFSVSRGNGPLAATLKQPS